MYSRHDIFSLSSSVSSSVVTCIGAEFRMHATSFPVLQHQPEKFDLLSTLLVALPWFPSYQALLASSYPSNIWKFPGQFFTHFRYCCVDSELISGNKCTKSHFGCFVVTTEMKRQFSFSFTFQSSSFQSTGSTEYGCPLSLKLIIMSSATRSHSPFGLYV